MYGPNLFRTDETKVERIYKPPREYATSTWLLPVYAECVKSEEWRRLLYLLTSTVHTRRLRYWLWQVKSIDVAVEWLKRAPFDQERKWNGKPSKKGTGFEQPPQPHGHSHIDISYLNVCATFYYLSSILYGYRRFLVHWDLRESMTEADIEIIWNELKSDTPGLNRGSFPTTDRSSSPRTSRNSFGPRA